jgi:hypothetical protein
MTSPVFQTIYNFPLVVLPGEDLAALEALALEYFDQFQPEGPAERFFVDTLVQCDWGRRRIARAQTDLFQRIDPKGTELYEKGATGADVYKMLSREQVQNERSYLRALTELRRLQKQRQPDPEPTPQKARKPQAVPMPDAIGFVPPASAHLKTAKKIRPLYEACIKVEAAVDPLRCLIQPKPTPASEISTA